MAVGLVQARTQFINGRAFFIVTGPDGRIKQIVEAPNMMVQGGRDLLASNLGQSDTDPGAQWLALGTGQSVASDDTTLTGELSIAGSRVKACFSHVAGSYNWTLKATWAGLAASRTFFQAGALISATDGQLFAKLSFDSVAVASQDTLTVKWTFSIE